MIYWYSSSLDEFRESPWSEYWVLGLGMVLEPEKAYAFFLRGILYTAFPRTLPAPYPGWTAVAP